MKRILTSSTRLRKRSDLLAGQCGSDGTDKISSAASKKRKRHVLTRLHVSVLFTHPTQPLLLCVLPKGGRIIEGLLYFHFHSPACSLSPNPALVWPYESREAWHKHLLSSSPVLPSETYTWLPYPSPFIYSLSNKYGDKRN